MVSTETQNEPTTAGKCLWSAQPQMWHQYHVSFSSSGTTDKERWEESRSQRSGKTRLKECLLDMTGLMNSQAHELTSQTAVQHGAGKDCLALIPSFPILYYCWLLGERGKVFLKVWSLVS